MNFYKKHIGDFNNATRHLSRLERSIYSDAIELYYLNEKPLTSNLKILEKLLLIKIKKERIILKEILDEFFILKENYYFNKRCEKEIDKYQQHKEKSRQGGLTLASTKTQAKDDLGTSSHNHNQNHNQNHNHNHNQNHQPEPELKPSSSSKPSSKSKTSSKSKDLSPLAALTAPIESKITPKIRGSTLPADWFLPIEWGEWTLSEKPIWSMVDVKKVAENFKDYWLANANQAKSKKLDWQRAWRNWVRNEIDRNARGRSVAEENRAVAERWKADHAKIIGGTNENIGTQ